METPGSFIQPPPLPPLAPPIPAPLEAVAPKPPGPRLGMALLGCVVVFALSFFAGIPLAVYSFIKNEKPDTLLITFVGQMVSWPLGLWLASVFIKRPWRESYAIKSFSLSILPGLIIGCFGLTFVCNYVAGLIPMPKAIHDMFLAMSQGNPWLLFLSITIIAPIAEELFFRGWMLRGFLANYSATRSIWITAALFALFHLNPWQAIVALPLGVLFGWLVLRTGSLAPCIIGHFVVNFTSIYLMGPTAMLMGLEVDTTNADSNLPTDLLATGVALSVVGLGLLGWSVRAAQRDTPRGKDEARDATAGGPL